ncbi:MAG: preprotein translocase subunit SecG [Bdellovibrionaceae bacterium]|nr:preprotein translocase subunit SecG [Pseudobdellovibrionaceae bacterium]NUM56997.1 preprotein translocase subunit SecG [Pseudobdellovibrionaceae bacterium]
MIGFLTVIHILIAVSLCALVLIQDSKGGGALGMGGGGSNSILGATGAQTLAARLTKIVAILFAVSCVALTYFLAHENRSVVDQLGAQTLTAPTTETKVNSDKPAGTGEANTANPSNSQTTTAPAETSTKESSTTTSGQAPVNVKK